MASLRDLDIQVAEEVLGQYYSDGDEPPQYSIDIADAWGIINKLSHFAPVIFKCAGCMIRGEDGRPEGGEWGCRFDLSLNGKEQYILGYGDTPAEAICRAGLECVRTPRTPL
jgi:hypothetical protein